MGKNPNANRLKVNKHKERSYDTNLEDKEQKALEMGCEVWEVDNKLREQEKADDDEISEAAEEQEEEQKEHKVVDFDKKFGIVQQPEEEEEDSDDDDDDELERLYGRGKARTGCDDPTN